MMNVNSRSWQWWLVQVQYWIASTLYAAANVGIWYVVFSLVFQIVRDGQFWFRHPWLYRVWLSVGEMAFTFPRWALLEQVMLAAMAAGTVSLLRLAYSQWRYGFAGQLAAIRRLLVWDPQMALVRQRTVLEAVVIEMTGPMNGNKTLNLNDRLKALAMLGKLPDIEARRTRFIRRKGNQAAHPHDWVERREPPVTDRDVALGLALEGQRKLKRFLRWYRKHGRRHRMTPQDWAGIRHAFMALEPAQDSADRERSNGRSGRRDDSANASAAVAGGGAIPQPRHRVAGGDRAAGSRRGVHLRRHFPPGGVSVLDEASDAAMTGTAALNGRTVVRGRRSPR